jgi:hypothetical protein
MSIYIYTVHQGKRFLLLLRSTLCELRCNLQQSKKFLPTQLSHLCLDLLLDLKAPLVLLFSGFCLYMSRLGDKYVGAIAVSHRFWGRENIQEVAFIKCS